MPKYEVIKHHTMTIPYITVVKAPYGWEDTPERMEENRRQRISAESIAAGIRLENWTANYETVEEDFEIISIKEIPDGK